MTDYTFPTQAQLTAFLENDRLDIMNNAALWGGKIPLRFTTKLPAIPLTLAMG